MKILVIDDDPGLRKSLTMILKDAEYDVTTAGSGEDGLRIAAAGTPDVILTDVRMPGMGGLEFLDAYRDAGGDALVLVMAYGSMDLAVEAMKKGAYDYLPKPFGADEVLLTVKKAEERERLRREVGRLRKEVRTEAKFGEIIARAPAMIRALEVAGKVARHPSPVLIQGPSGTGKELVARLIHRESTRAEAAFVPVNCGAIPETLLESEFFGYVKEAFSGADRDKEGLSFEASDKGTLFLDEVGELPATLQVKLLRTLQDGEIRRLGGTDSRKVDVRILAATNRNLREMVDEGDFREDLYYRLAVIPISLPPLKERPEEIPDLTRHFVERHADRLGIQIDIVDSDAMEVLLKHAWPGNIWELENLLEQAMVLSDGPTLKLEDLPERVRRPDPEAVAMAADLGDDLSVKRHTASLERRLIQLALERTGGNRTHAAELLELSPRALRYKIRDYELD